MIMKYKYIIIHLFAVLLCLPSALFAQLSDAEKNALNEQAKGFDFYFNGGTYFGNKFHAGFYNGSSSPDVDVKRVLNNYQLKKQIDDLIAERQNIILDANGVSLAELPENMRYNISFIFGFGILYHLNRNLSLSLSFSQARLTAVSGFTLTYNSGVPGNEKPQILEYNLIGKEVRTFFELGVTYMFYANKHALPFLELAAQLNSVKVKSADMIIEDNAFSMIDYYGGQTYDPTIDQTRIDPYLGGVGGGVLAGAGLRIPFTKAIAIEPVFQLHYSFINLEVNDLKKMLPHYNIMIRLIVGDKIFAKS